MKIPALQLQPSSSFSQLDLLPIKAIVFNEAGLILYANHAWRDYFGGMLARKGDHWWSALALDADKSGFAAKWQKAVSAKENFRSTAILRASRLVGDARKHLVEVASFHHAATPALWCACFTEALEPIAESSAGTAASQKLLLATIAHELRNPLFTILGWAKVFQELRPYRNPDLAQAVEAIEKNSLQAAQIVEDTLDLSRLIQGKVKLDHSRVNIDALARSALEKAKSKAENRRILLKIHKASHSSHVLADSQILGKAIQRMIGCALKLCSDEGTLKFELWEKDGQLLLCASCDLDGVDPESLTVIADWFDPAVKVCQGLVLGLGWAKGIAEMHGGSLMAKSAGPGKGSSFRLSLPAVT